MKAGTGLKRLARAVRTVFLLGEIEADNTASPISLHPIMLLLFMAAAALMALGRGQDRSFDVLNYHFYNGYAFLHKPLNYDFAPAQLQSFFNPLVQVLTYLMLAHLPAKGTAMLLGAIQGINFYLVFRISLVIFRSWGRPYRELLGLINAASGFYGTINFIEIGSTFGDNLGSLLILTGLLLILDYLMSDSRESRRSILSLGIAGTILGMALGLKLTTVIYVFAVWLALMLFLWVSSGRVRRSAVFCGGLLAGFLVSYGAWGINELWAFRSPFFPFWNNIFHSPYAGTESFIDARFMPAGWQQALFYPFFFARKNHLVCETYIRDARLAASYVAVVLLIAAASRWLALCALGVRPVKSITKRDQCLLFLAVILVPSYVLWQELFSIYRYLAVHELLAPVFLALVIARFLPWKPVVLGLCLLLNFAICRGVMHAELGRQAFDDKFLQVDVPPFPELSRSVVLMAGGQPTSYIVPSFPPSTRFVRVESNFTFPGKNPLLDQKIRALLGRYDSNHTLVFVAEGGELEITRSAAAYFGVILDGASCQELKTHTGRNGLLCGTAVLH